MEFLYTHFPLVFFRKRITFVECLALGACRRCLCVLDASCVSFQLIQIEAWKKQRKQIYRHSIKVAEAFVYTPYTDMHCSIVLFVSHS